MSGPANTQFALGVHLITLLAGHPGGPLSSDAMAGSANSNPVHVRRVLGELRRGELVSSRPGPHGGWQLAVDPRTITLADVWFAVHGERPVLGLHGPNPDCPVGRRVQEELVAIDRHAAAAIRAELATTTIAELAERIDAGALLTV